MNQDTYEQFENRVHVTIDDFKMLKRLVTRDIFQRIGTQIDYIYEWLGNITNVIDKKQFIYAYQKYSLQKNFMRARDAMEERTLSVLCLGFHEHVFNTELFLRQMLDAMKQNKTDADIFYTLLNNMLRSRIETAGRAANNYTQLFNAYANGQRIFNYKFKSIPRTHNNAIIPKALLNESLYHNYYARRYSSRVGTDINRVMNASAEFGLFAEDLYTNVTQNIDILKMNKLSEEFLDSCEDYFHSKSTFYFETIDRPLRVIEERIFHFSALAKELEKHSSELLNALFSLKNELSELQTGFLDSFENYMQIAQDYFSVNNTANITKMEIAKMFASKSLNDKLYTLSIFFTDVRQKGQFAYEQWFNIMTITLKIWEIVLYDIDSIDYYKFENIEAFLQNFTDVYNTTHEKILTIQEKTDLRDIIGNTDHVFAETIASLRGELDKFIEESQMGETFIRYLVLVAVCHSVDIVLS